MNHKYLILFLLFFCKNLFCLEIQYFISDFFYKNPHSYTINGSRLIKYYPGKLMESAASTNSKIFKKCEKNNQSDFIINLHPISVYDSFLRKIVTEMRVQLYSANDISKEFQIEYEEQIFLKEYSEDLITEHYSRLLNILYNEIALKKIPAEQIHGDICSQFN